MDRKEKTEKINNKISELKEKHKGVKGTITEVYMRICGYCRSVDSWNAGKAQEAKDRKMFVLK